MDRLTTPPPPGFYLCARCLRGRRPALEEVDAVLLQQGGGSGESLHHSLEHVVVRRLVDQARLSFSRLRETIGDESGGPPIVGMCQEDDDKRMNE
jgi:hypothetical protein